jgi:hypothetical protein
MTREYFDGFEKTYGTGDDCMQEMKNDLLDMNAHDSWKSGEHGITSKTTAMQEITPMQMLTKDTPSDGRLIYMNELDPDLLEETMSPSGTHLLFVANHYGMLVRRCAIDTISQAASLTGGALNEMLKQMKPYAYAGCMNYAFDVGNKRLITLERYGKLTAVHSDAGNGYEIMPISELFQITIDALCDKYGDVEMLKGYNSHEYTEATFMLPSIQQESIDKYQGILDMIGSKYHASEFMPAVRFRTSDTADSMARLRPVFLSNNGAEIAFCKGVEVRHCRATGGAGRPMDIFRDGAYHIFAKFEEAYANIEKLAERQVYHAKNFVVLACEKLGIAKKYMQAALDEAEYAAEGVAYVNGHDMYIVMTKVIEAAMQSGAPQRTVTDLDEAVSRIPDLDWANLDVSVLPTRK